MIYYDKYAIRTNILIIIILMGSFKQEALGYKGQKIKSW